MKGIDIGGGTTQGLITYMRTDGVQIAARGHRRQPATSHRLDAYGQRYLPGRAAALSRPRPRTRRRPTKPCARRISCRDPDERQPSYLDARTRLKLYEADLAADHGQPDGIVAELERTTADIETSRARTADLYGLRATGTVVRFDGFLKLYEEGRDDAADERRRPPPAAARRRVEPSASRSLDAKQHFTEPPPRYSQATLVKKMEELGIGRPLTYASTIGRAPKTATTCRMEKRQIVHPEDKGRLVTAFLSKASSSAMSSTISRPR